MGGSKFKGVNNRDKNFTKGTVERQRAQLEEHVARYLNQPDTSTYRSRLKRLRQDRES